MGHPSFVVASAKCMDPFVGSPWLCQGLRCLRMTAFRGRMRPFDNSPEMMPSVCWFPLFKVVILSGTDSLASLFPESKDLLFARATDLPPNDCCRALAESRSLDSARSSASGRSCCARDDRGGLEERRLWSSKLPP
jgi:hypothetical protein